MNEKVRTNSWVTTTVGEVAMLVRGITYNKEQASKSSSPDFKPILRANNINGTLNFDDLVFVPQHLIRSEQIIKAGDIIFAMSSGSKHLVGKSARARFDFDGSYGAFCGLLRAHEHVDENFLYYVFQNNKFRRLISEVAKGSNINNLKREHILDFEIVLPPLPEQHRIVAKIEELFSGLDKGIESLKTARTQLKVYRQALLKHAFEGKLTAQWRAENQDKLETADALLKRIQQERAQRYQQQLADWEAAGKQGSKPKAPKPLPPLTAEELAELPELPEGWGWVRPGEICVQEPYAIGIGPFGSNLKVSDYRESGIPLIFVKNITRSNFSNDLKYIDGVKYKELMPHSVKALDLLITKMGDPPGDCEIYPAGSPYAVLTADCLKFRLWDEFASRKLYKFCINSNFVKRQLGLITKGVAQKKISVERFKTIFLPFCCVEEQKVLVQELESKLSECDQLDQTLTTALQQAEALRQSILKKAFSGQLVPQDPHDEPASALLARIQAERAVGAKNAHAAAKTLKTAGSKQYAKNAYCKFQLPGNSGQLPKTVRGCHE